MYIYIFYIYICYHENNVPSRLSPQWLCGNSCTWAHDVRLQIADANEPKTVQQASSLGARDGLAQSFFYKIFDRFSFVNQTIYIKKAVVNFDVTGEITLGTKLKIPIFTLYSPHNLQSMILVF